MIAQAYNKHAQAWTTALRLMRISFQGFYFAVKSATKILFRNFLIT